MELLNEEQFNIIVELHSSLVRMKPKQLTIDDSKLVMVEGFDSPHAGDRSRSINTKNLVASLQSRLSVIKRWGDAKLSIKNSSDKVEIDKLNETLKNLYCVGKVRVPSDDVFTATFDTLGGKVRYQACKDCKVNDMTVSSLMTRFERYDNAAKALKNAS